MGRGRSCGMEYIRGYMKYNTRSFRIHVSIFFSMNKIMICARLPVANEKVRSAAIVIVAQFKSSQFLFLYERIVFFLVEKKNTVETFSQCLSNVLVMRTLGEDNKALGEIKKVFCLPNGTWYNIHVDVST